MVGGVRYIRYLTPQAVAPLACGQRRPRPVPCFPRVSRSADSYCNANCMQPPPQRPLRSSVSCPPARARLQLNMSRRPRQQAGARVRRRRHLLSYGMHEAQFLYVYGARGKQRGRDGLPESGIQSLRIWKKFSEMQAQETSLSPPCWYFPTVRNRAHGGNTYFVAHGYVTEIHYKVF